MPNNNRSFERSQQTLAALGHVIKCVCALVAGERVFVIIENLQHVDNLSLTFVQWLLRNKVSLSLSLSLSKYVCVPFLILCCVVCGNSRRTVR